MIKRLLFSILLLLLVGCSNSTVLMFEDLPSEGWLQEEWVSFSYKHRLPQKTVSLDWVLRHDNAYPFANIHLIAEWKNPKGISRSDTLSYLLAEPNGNWLGAGLYVKEHKLPFLNTFLLDEPGTYTFSVRPAVRANETLIGQKILPGIHQIGIALNPLSNE